MCFIQPTDGGRLGETGKRLRRPLLLGTPRGGPDDASRYTECGPNFA